MSAIAPVSDLVPLSTNSSLDPSRPRSVRQAAQQFESLLIAELLRMTHGDEGGWLGSGEDAASSSAVSIAEESLAQVLSSRGGFGLSEIVEKTLDAAATSKLY